MWQARQWMHLFQTSEQICVDRHRAYHFLGTAYRRAAGRQQLCICSCIIPARCLSGWGAEAASALWVPTCTGSGRSGGCSAGAGRWGSSLSWGCKSAHGLNAAFFRAFTQHPWTPTVLGAHVRRTPRSPTAWQWFSLAVIKDQKNLHSNFAGFAARA